MSLTRPHVTLHFSEQTNNFDPVVLHQITKQSYLSGNMRQKVITGNLV